MLFSLGRQFYRSTLYIELVFLQLLVNSRADQLWYGNWSRKRKTEFKSVKIDLVTHFAHVERLGKYTFILNHWISFTNESNLPCYPKLYQVFQLKALWDLHLHILFFAEERRRDLHVLSPWNEQMKENIK